MPSKSQRQRDQERRQPKNRLESIKERRQEYLDSIANYVEDEHEKKKDEFLYWAEQDIEYLLQRLERYEKALNQLATAERDHTLLSVERIAKDALKE